VWHDGGAYFGVPLSNFFGWYMTVYLIYQAFAWYLARAMRGERSMPVSYWGPAVAFYAVCAAGNLLVARPPVPEVRDAAGTVWSVSGILNASALVSIFVMGTFAALAWVRAGVYQEPNRS